VSNSSPSDTRVVLLVADPGLPSRRAQALKPKLARQLRNKWGENIELKVHTDLIHLTPNAELDLDDLHEITQQYSNVDTVLFLTEIPRYTEGKPLVAEVNTSHGVGIVSCPSLGPFATQKRIIRALIDCASKLGSGDEGSHVGERGFQHGEWQEGQKQDRLTLHSRTSLGAINLLFGMVATNSPWRTVPKLSGALAAAMGTAAFGVFYNSIWQMATYLSTMRLLAISVLAVAVLVTWLVFSRGLWDHPKNESLSTIVLFYNLSTVLTFAVTVATLYVVLFFIILIAGGVVIDPDFLAKQIGTEPTLYNYVALAWLSASLGVVGGGIGAGFDSDMDLKKLTQGQRMRQRVYTASDDQE
jgi:hypothetical protein